MKKKLDCVLLIDDDSATNFINNMLIKKSGITDRIEIVLNGEEALAFLTKNGEHESIESEKFTQPQLIFLDINMPVMDGWEFIEAYEALDNYKKDDTVIVMLTSSFNSDDRTRAQTYDAISNFKNKILTLNMIQDIMNEHFSEYI
ncbi:response regulator [Flavobacterium aestivum]|uniref:response regulator n=1 Tax=Flavobacterium aestivum TaxID=3003257 RepID=UPI002285E79A|nr:response regulator [Flavobacterium aestivum]